MKQTHVRKGEIEMLGIEESTLKAQFVSPIDEHLLPQIDKLFWGVVLQRDENSAFIPVGNNSEFAKYFKSQQFDPVQMLVAVVTHSSNQTALELIDQVRSEQEAFLLNGTWFDWEDLQGARGDIGDDGTFDRIDDEYVEI